MALLNESLKFCVEKLRNLKFKTLDLINEDLKNQIHSIEGVSFFEDHTKDQIVFALPLTSTLTKIVYPDDTLCLKEIVNNVNLQTQPVLFNTFKIIVDILSKSDFIFDHNRLLH